MTRQKIKYLLVALGIFDILSFYRLFLMVLAIFGNRYFMLNHGTEFLFNMAIVTLDVILAALLLPSGILLILGKKAGIIIYYFAFPLRFLFLTFTFGFILPLLALQPGSVAYKVELTFIVILEVSRLAVSIWVHRKYYSAERDLQHL